jgi:hypothetical protein
MNISGNILAGDTLILTAGSVNDTTISGTIIPVKV